MLYELSCLLNPDLSERQADEFTKKLESILANGGKIIKKDPAKKIGLAYPIKKQSSAFIFSIMFEATPEKMGVLKSKLDKDTGIIRFLLVKTKIEEDRPPRIEQNAADEAGKGAKPKGKKQTEASIAVTAVDEAEKTKVKKARPAISKEKESAKKVDMEKIETELNKILNES